jgi:hypothetical protein
MDSQFKEIAATIEKIRKMHNQQKIDFEDCIALDNFEFKQYKEKISKLEMENQKLKEENERLRRRVNAVLMTA